METQQQLRVIAGVETSVYDEAPPSGGKATIVFVHGGDPRSLSNALDWSTVWCPTLLNARLIAYDKPGQGRSYTTSMDASLFNAEALSQHLEELVREVGTPVVLVGHSRGALPVADVALRCPELVQAVVLVASNTLAPPSLVTPKDFYVQAYADPPAELDEEFLRREPQMNSYSTQHIDAQFLDGRRAAAMESGWWRDRDHRLQAYENTTQPSLEKMRTRCLERLRDVGLVMPVWQIWGNNDVSAPVILAQELFQVLTSRGENATSVVINHSAHYVYREHPAPFMGLLRLVMETL